MSESCGKCVPCRVGTDQMHDLLEQDHGRRSRRRPIWNCWRTVRPGAGTPACAGWGSRRPIPCSARCAISATSTSRTSKNKHCPAGVCTGAQNGRRRSMKPQRSEIKTLKIDGRDVSARGDQTILAGGAGEQHLHSHAVPPGGPLATWAPAASAWWRSRAATNCCRPASPASRKAWKSRLNSERLQSTAADPGIALRRAQPRLLGLRRQRPLRAAEPGA